MATSAELKKKKFGSLVQELKGPQSNEEKNDFLNIKAEELIPQRWRHLPGATGGDTAAPGLVGGIGLST